MNSAYERPKMSINVERDRMILAKRLVCHMQRICCGCGTHYRPYVDFPLLGNERRCERCVLTSGRVERFPASKLPPIECLTKESFVIALYWLWDNPTAGDVFYMMQKLLCRDGLDQG